MAANARYAEIRFNDRPIKEQLSDPESFVLEPGEITADYEKKSPWRLEELHPNIADYRTAKTSRSIDPAVMAVEEERLWSKVWLLAGISSDIPDVGDWFRFDLGRQSMIIVRNKEGVAAFYILCIGVYV